MAPMTVPQFGIFAQGTIAHEFIEFDLRPDVDMQRATTALSQLRAPAVAAGGVNLVIGFGSELWRTVAPDQAPADLAIALFEGCRAQLGLGVAESRDRLDGDLCLLVTYECVEGAEVTGDVERSLQLPAPSVSNSCAKATEEVELRCVAQAAASWVEAGVELEADDRAVAHRIDDGEAGQEAELNAADGGMGHGHRPSDIDLPQAACQPRLPEVRPKLHLEATPAEGGVIGAANAIGHRPEHAGRSLSVP